MKHALCDGTELFSIKRPMRFRNQIDKNVNGRHVLIDLDNNVNFYKLRNENIVYCKKILRPTLSHSIYGHRMNSSLFFTKLWIGLTITGYYVRNLLKCDVYQVVSRVPVLLFNQLPTIDDCVNEIVRHMCIFNLTFSFKFLVLIDFIWR